MADSADSLHGRHSSWQSLAILFMAVTAESPGVTARILTDSSRHRFFMAVKAESPLQDSPSTIFYNSWLLRPDQS
jgi:hypothetical protein